MIPLICAFLLLFGGFFAVWAALRPNAALEMTAGLLIAAGLALLGYQLHKIISI